MLNLRNRAIMLLLILILMAGKVSASESINHHFFGVSSEVSATIKNDIEWVSDKNFDRNKILRDLFSETGIDLTSGDSIQSKIRDRFPVIVSESFRIRKCFKSHKECSENDFYERRKSIQNLPESRYGIYTPYIEKRKDQNLTIALDNERWLTVENLNNVIMTVNEDRLKREEDFEYKIWIRLSELIGLARLYDSFVKEGKAPDQCESITGDLFNCDSYQDGSFLIRGVFLIAATNECEDCSTKELALMAREGMSFILRSKRGSVSEKLIESTSDAYDFLIRTVPSVRKELKELKRWHIIQRRKGPVLGP